MSNRAQSSDPAMQAILSVADRLGQSPDTPSLIEGDSGVGKEWLARRIHAATPARRAGPFVAVSCAATQGPSLEEEVFGSEPPSNGTTHPARLGFIDAAEGGTLFLGDIADLAPPTQAKLVQLVENRRFRRLGSVHDREAGIRVVLATRQDTGTWRPGSSLRDLAHRVAVRIRVPPLRERPQEILPLARAFLAEQARRLGKELHGFAPEAEARLSAHAFPGNVLELRTIIERAAILESGPVIGAAAIELGRPGPTGRRPWFPDALPSDTEDQTRPPTLIEVEREYIARLLEHARGNRSRVARLMGVSYPTVVKKIADYGIDVSRFKA